VRVISGDKGGRRLVPPGGALTRPTSDRVREAVFSMLESHIEMEGALVWDLFAGSGALGVEALSRRASHVTFVDRSHEAVAAVKANLASLGYGHEKATVVRSDVLKWARAPKAPASGQPDSPGPPDKCADLVMADPPYAWWHWEELLGLLVPPPPLVLIETDRSPPLPAPWQVVKARRYGGTLVTLAALDGPTVPPPTVLTGPGPTATGPTVPACPSRSGRGGPQ